MGWRGVVLALSSLCLARASAPPAAGEHQVPACCGDNATRVCCGGRDEACCGQQKLDGRLSVEELGHFFDWDFDWDIDGDWITLCAIVAAMLLAAILYWCCQRRRTTWSSHLRKHHYLATYQYGTFFDATKA